MKPSLALFEDGIALLQRTADVGWNHTHGWDLAGLPRDVVPATDDAWKSRGVSAVPRHLARPGRPSVRAR